MGGGGMITDFFITLFEGILSWIASMIPSDLALYDQPISLDVFADMNYFLPLAELSGVLGSFMFLIVPFASITIILWIAIGVVRGGDPRA